MIRKLKHVYALKFCQYMNFNFKIILNKKVPFVMTPARVLGISSLNAGIFLFILFALGASETDSYVAPYKYIRLSGYALCIVIPYFLFYLMEKRLQNAIKSWKLIHEITSKILLAFTILSVSYLYNISIVNNISFSLYNYYYFMVWYGLPYLPLLIPGAVFLHLQFIKKETSEAVTGTKKTTSKTHITITGKNKEEKLKLDIQDFIFAEANQNYVTIKYLKKNRVHKKIIRSTLSEVDNQIPNAHRIHRSYLVNPDHIKRINGNSRKKKALLSIPGEKIPVSPSIKSDDPILQS